MSCNNCSNGTDMLPKGCKNNGACGDTGCEKLTVFDWLSNMALPGGQELFNIVEVNFKNGRKDFYKNIKNSALCMGDLVAVDASPGHDIGSVSLTGELVKIQMRKKNVASDSPEIKQVYRKASQRDIDIWKEARSRESEVQQKSRLIINRLGLQMKLSDVEFQGDGNKATFYYTADDRVDFRQLIKELAAAFRIRVEMRQVGLRQEAARLGGIGSCGRELCCSTWLTDFRSVNTAAARYQQLSLNPQKLAGQCGKLKCCLNYELDSYLDALRDFPKTEINLTTAKGIGVFQKMDIFKGLLWYAYEDNSLVWYKLTKDQVHEVVEKNKKNVKVESLEKYATEAEYDTEKDSSFSVVGQDSLNRFDKKSKKRKRRNRNAKRKSPRDNG